MSGPPSRDEASDFSRAGLSPAGKEVLDRVAGGASAATASAVEVAEALALRPHCEGGFFRETYRSPLTLPTSLGERCLATSILYLLTCESPSRFHRLRSDEIWFYHAGCPVELALLPVDRGRQPEVVPRPTGLQSASRPTWPQGASRPTWPPRPPGGQEGRLRLHLLGPERPQVFVPGGWWLGARVAPGGPSGEGAGGLGDGIGDGAGEDERAGAGRDWTLVGCVVTPGFEYEDFEPAEPASLLREFPEAADIIRALT